MNKHYEEKVTAKYIGHRQYEVTVSEISVTKNEKGKEIRETVKNTRTVFSEPTLLSSFLAGETLAESCRRRILEIEEEFKLYDFDKFSLHSIVEALDRAARKVDRVLPQPYML